MSSAVELGTAQVQERTEQRTHGGLALQRGQVTRWAAPAERAVLPGTRGVGDPGCRGESGRWGPRMGWGTLGTPFPLPG
jgi:hypothetical protein